MSVTTESDVQRAMARTYRALGYLITSATVGLLFRTLGSAYIYDDTTVIRDNVLLRGWSAVLHVWSSPYWPSDGPQNLGLYRPLQLSILSLIWNLGGGSPFLFHLYAVVLAVACSVAVYAFLYRATGAAAVLLALWFAAHPLHVEPVASVANSSELIVVLATLGIVWCMWRPVIDWRVSIGVGILAAAAIAAKESGLFALPLAAVTAWGWHAEGGRVSVRTFARGQARSLVAGMLGVLVIIAARLMVLGAPVSNASIAAQGLDTLSASDRILGMMSLWPRIGWMMIWPSSLAPYYGPTIFPSARAVYAFLGLVILLSLVAGAVYMARRGDRRVAVAVAWIVLTYLPASNLITPTGQILADRTLFGVTVGVAMLMAVGLSYVPTTKLRWYGSTLAVLLVHNLYVGESYVSAWRTHRTLWTRLAEVEPGEMLPYKLLGMDARARNENERATAYLRRALAMKPSDRQVRFELGQAEFAFGEYMSAVQTLTPLLKDTDVRGEPQFVAMYFEAVGRAYGSPGVADAAKRLLHTEADSVARRYLEAAGGKP